LESVVLKDQATGQVYEEPYDAAFIFIGLTPNSEMVRGQAEVDPYGFVCTDPALMTTLRGLFAAGDVRAGSTKQAAAAVGEGATAALMMRTYLKTQ
jgi:thioredoxin reductase (NADPH)